MRERIWPHRDAAACQQLELALEDFTITVMAVRSIEVIDMFDLKEAFERESEYMGIYGPEQCVEVVHRQARNTKLPNGFAYVELSHMADREAPRVAGIVDLREVEKTGAAT
jgi:hypothetical protein